MKLTPNGFRIWKFEFYTIKGGSAEWRIDKGSCQCWIFTMGKVGFTILSSKYDCYQKAGEDET